MAATRTCGAGDQAAQAPPNSSAPRLRPVDVTGCRTRNGLGLLWRRGCLPLRPILQQFVSGFPIDRLVVNSGDDRGLPEILPFFRRNRSDLALGWTNQCALHDPG